MHRTWLAASLLVLCVAVSNAQLLSAVVQEEESVIPREIDGNLLFGVETSEREDTTGQVTTTQATTVQPVQTTRHVFVQQKPACKLDSDCGRPGKVFCDRHYGKCNVCIRERQLCRQNSHCCKGMTCSYGRCALPLKPGRVGSDCKRDADCGSEMCCARHWGRPICKATLQENDMCEPASGGLWWSLHSHCHCATGLGCIEAVEPVRLQIGRFVLSFPFTRRTSRCRPVVSARGTVSGHSTTVRPAWPFFF